MKHKIYLEYDYIKQAVRLVDSSYFNHFADCMNKSMKVLEIEESQLKTTLNNFSSSKALLHLYDLAEKQTLQNEESLAKQALYESFSSLYDIKFEN